MFDVFYFDGTLKKATSLKEAKKFVWIDITNISEKESKMIKDHFDLHPLTIEDLYKRVTRIKVEEFPSYIFCVFYGISHNKSNGKKSFAINEMDFVLGDDYLITNHITELETFKGLKKDTKLLTYLLERGPEYIFHHLLDKEVDNYLPIIDEMSDKLEDIEERIVKRPTPTDMAKILHLKREFRNLKKIGFQQREKVSYLAKNEYKHISKKAKPYFRDIYDHVIRVSDSIDSYRDAIGETFEAYMSSVSNNMNEVMKFLSMIATMALPMTVISGIYGTNFLNLPGSAAYYGFYVMIGIMLTFSIGMIIYFRRKGWM